MFLFGLTIWSATVSSLSHTPDKVQTVAEAESYLDKALTARLKKSPNLAKAQADLVAATKVIEAKPFRTKPTARSVIAMEAEAKLPLSDRALNILRKSDESLDGVLLRIYKAKDFNDDIPTLVKQLPKGEILTRAATAFAYDRRGLSPPTSATAAKTIPKVGLAILSFTVLIGIMTGVITLLFILGGTLKPLGLSARNLTLLDADRLAIFAALVFGAVEIGEIIVQSFAVQFDFSRAETGIASLLAVGCVLLATRIKVIGKPLSAEESGLGLDHLGKKLVLGVVGFLCEWPVSLTILTVSSLAARFLPKAEHPLATALAGNHNAGMLIFALCTASIVAPISEEIIFRGLLFPAMSRLTGRIWLGGLLSSLLFASLHPQGIAAWLALASIGGASCMLTYYTRSLIPSIILHALHNTTILVLSVFMAK